MITSAGINYTVDGGPKISCSKAGNTNINSRMSRQQYQEQSCTRSRNQTSIITKDVMDSIIPFPNLGNSKNGFISVDNEKSAILIM